MKRIPHQCALDVGGPGVTAVAVEHRDRPGRVNTELAESALAAHGRRLVVLGDGGVDDGLVREMVEVLTWFCAGLHGRASARKRAWKAAGCAQRDVSRLAWRGVGGRCG